MKESCALLNLKYSIYSLQSNVSTLELISRDFTSYFSHSGTRNPDKRGDFLLSLMKLLMQLTHENQLVLTFNGKMLQ